MAVAIGVTLQMGTVPYVLNGSPATPFHLLTTFRLLLVLIRQDRHCCHQLPELRGVEVCIYNPIGPDSA